jgi:Na+/melibiose symporter-like transporter
MKWIQVLNMMAAAYVVAIGVIMLVAMLMEPDTLRGYTGQTVGIISIAGIVLFIVCALYVGLRTVYQAIRALYLRD